MKRGLGRYICPPWQVKTPVNRRHQTHLGYVAQSHDPCALGALGAAAGACATVLAVAALARRVVEDQIRRLPAKYQATLADPAARQLPIETVGEGFRQNIWGSKTTRSP